jgi:hypothetical protein
MEGEEREYREAMRDAASETETERGWIDWCQGLGLGWQRRKLRAASSSPGVGVLTHANNHALTTLLLLLLLLTQEEGGHSYEEQEAASEYYSLPVCYGCIDGKVGGQQGQLFAIVAGACCCVPRGTG